MLTGQIVARWTTIPRDIIKHNAYTTIIQQNYLITVSNQIAVLYVEDEYQN